ncbi:transmembrane protein DUF3566 [Kribbella sp. VKM Ac-2527]|uniref:Transmembrane protein DUF3566 n=1 Tax=Kribbella caucasensis TaxID=2512215 RepID=A0A4R6KTP4_9ACTN|nr:DUF3566 domain-containing protein [Kribbella sp. VKM Ac-2527]TDO54898.1 transmembrane protein DUF3566 [Kribbella sp. VKM Ac-2527]
MTNRARPTWPDGADNAKSQRSPQGGNGKAPSNPPAGPASNGRAGGSQPRPGTPNGQKAAQNPTDLRPQPRTVNQPQPGGSQPGPSGGSQSGPSSAGSKPGSSGSKPGSSVGSKPARPPQQPPVRPVSKQSQPSPSIQSSSIPPISTHPGVGQPGLAVPAAKAGQSPVGQRPASVTPSTPGRPEPRLTSGPATPGQPATPAYGQTGKLSSPSAKSTETFGDRVSAAKQAVLDKAAAVKEAASTDKPRPSAATEPAPRPSTRGQVRKARLRLARLDPWSVMKTSFLLSIAFGIVTWVAVFIVWSAIGAAGVFDNINNTVSEVLGTPSAEPFRIENYINTGKVMGFTTLLACADVLILTALATLGSFLYNIAATLLGGLEVTLASED